MKTQNYNLDFWGAMICSFLTTGTTSGVFTTAALIAAILQIRITYKKVDNENS